MNSNANVQLLDDEGNMLSGSFNSGKADEYQVHEDLEAGDYYLKVYGGGTNYSLDFGLQGTIENIENSVDQFKVEIRYRNAFPGAYHADIVVTRPDGTVRSYWGRAINGSPGFYGDNIGFDSETDEGEEGYVPGYIFYVDDPARIQEIYSSDSDDLNIEQRIVQEFENIESAELPYDPLGRNSNSAAFEVLERVFGSRPIPDVNVPAWEIDPYTGRNVGYDTYKELKELSEPDVQYNPYRDYLIP